MLTSEGTKVGPRLGIAHSNLLLWARADIDCEWCETAIQRRVIPTRLVRWGRRQRVLSALNRSTLLGTTSPNSHKLAVSGSDNRATKPAERPRAMCLTLPLVTDRGHLLVLSAPRDLELLRIGASLRSVQNSQSRAALGRCLHA